MTPREIEEIATKRSVRIPEAEAACEASGRDLKALLDEISLGVACRYVDGNASFDYCDAIMNNLFNVILLGEKNVITSDLAWEIFLAFDAGEYHHQGDAPDINPEKKYTHPMLFEILRREMLDKVRNGKLTP